MKREDSYQCKKTTNKLKLMIVLFFILLLSMLPTQVKAENMGIYTLEDGCITRILPETTIAELKEDLSTEQVVVKDTSGKTVEDTSIAKTGMTLETNGEQYKISVVGDTSGDGKISITDVVQCKLHTISIKKLEGEREKSADINNNGKCTITDLVQLNLVSIKIKDITDYVKYQEEIDLELSGMIQEEYTSDGDEDKDGLTNGEEETLGTNVYSADTDNDGLTDYYEINVSNTDPLKADTDGDGINDGNEVAMDLNPLAVDSKGDGINDGERTLTYEMQDEKTGVDIDITGKGNIASTTVDALDISQAEENEELLDTIYNFCTKGTMESAVVTIKYTTEELETAGLSEDNIALYYIDEDDYSLEKLNSTVDKNNKTITATLEHFSMYIIGKDDLTNFKFYVKRDQMIDIDDDGRADEIVLANSGFDPKVDGFSFNNYGSNKSEGGNCYGMATFAMAYYLDKLPLTAEAETKSFWALLTHYTWESNGYDLTGTYFEDGGNLYDFKVETEGLKYQLEYELNDLMDYDGITDGLLKIKDEYYQKLEKIGTIFKIYKIKKKSFNQYQRPLVNLGSAELENNVTKDENQMLNAIWSLYMLQADDSKTTFASDPDLAFQELQANLQNGVPVVLGGNGHAINAISLTQDLEDSDKYKIAVYDNNYPGEIRYIDVTRYKQHIYYFSATAFTNEYGYKCIYDGEEISLEIHYPEIPETNNSIYVALYDDGTLAFSSTTKGLVDRAVEGGVKVVEWWDISNDDFEDNTFAPWGGYQYGDKVTKVDIVDKIKPKTTANWFHGLSNLQEIKNINNLDTGKVISMYEMFMSCNSLTKLDLSHFDTSNVTNMACMFDGCSALSSLDLSNFNTSKVTDMSYMFYVCNSLTSLDVSSFDTSNVTNMRYMFGLCGKLTSLDLGNFNTSNVTDMHCMFGGFYDHNSSLTELDLSNFDTSNVTNMDSMFERCSNLISLNISNFDTGNVTNMKEMFYKCNSLTSLDLSHFDTSNVTNMSDMFYHCSGLTSLDLSNFDTSNVTTMDGMFSGCNGLSSLNVSNFDTSNVTDMSVMFFDCSSLTSLDLSNFDTNKVVNMRSMFNSCSGLTILDLSSFDISNVTNMSYMFRYCTNLTTIYVNSKWNTDNAETELMFSFCGTKDVTRV